MLLYTVDRSDFSLELFTADGAIFGVRGFFLLLYASIIASNQICVLFITFILLYYTCKSKILVEDSGSPETHPLDDGPGH